MNVVSLFDGGSVGRLALIESGIEVDNYFASEIEKHAIDNTAINFPDVKQLGDVTKWREWDLPKIDLIIGGSPCFAAGTKVITDNGYKNIEDVEIGDMVLTHKNRYRKVLRTGGDFKEIYKIKGDGIWLTETTAEHPYYTANVYDLNQAPKWTKVKDLNITHLLGIPNSHFTGDKNKRDVVGDVSWVSIDYVLKTREVKKVYNLEVEEDNSYTANNAIVHNCQGFSRQGNGLNFNHPQSKLFFEYVDILKHLKEINPNLKFMLENVNMKKEWENVITEMLGVKPVKINSDVFVPQNRPRTYWANFEIKQPEPKSVKLLDILEDVELQDYELIAGVKVCNSFSDDSKELITVGRDGLRIAQAVKKGYIVAEKGDGINISFPTSKTRRGRVVKVRSSCLDTSCDIGVYDQYGQIRRFTRNELERLQGLPDGFTETLNDSQAKSLLGNGWTVDVITHIFKCLKEQT